MPPARSRRPSAGWLPRQHGAWFMLALPVVAGWLLRIRETGAATPELLPVVGCWFAGYLAFNAATVWLKAPPARRAAARTPTIAYGAISGALGLAALLSCGLSLIGWLAAFAPLAAIALWLASAHRERSLASGAVTVLMASLMTLVTRFVTPDALGAAVSAGTATSALLSTGLVFGYLFGTVLYVKTMIRERGQVAWVAASVGWHAAVAAVAAWLAAAGALTWPWPALFAAATLRALLVPAIATRARVTPMAVGIVEIGFTVAFVAVSAAA